MTTNLKWARFPFGVAVSAGDGGLVHDSVVLCHQLRVIDKMRLQRRFGQVDAATMARVEQAIHVTLGL